MTVEVWSRNMMESTLVQGDLASLVNNMNIAAATGKQFVIVAEHPHGNGVALETRNITIMRDLRDENAFIG